MHYLDSKSHRLPEYDYSQPGWYFVTLSTRNMSCLFGDVRNGVINLTDAGRMVERVWQELWGTRFHDHVIRTESALQSIRSYIQNNPRKWDLDRLNK
jgi:hypothetical protein